MFGVAVQSGWARDISRFAAKYHMRYPIFSVFESCDLKLRFRRVGRLNGSNWINASRLSHKIQSPSAARLLCRCGCRLPRCRHWMGNSQTGATLLACSHLRRICQGPRLALLADVVLCSVCDSAYCVGYRRWLGHVAEHDHRLVHEIRALGGFRS